MSISFGELKYRIRKAAETLGQEHLTGIDVEQVHSDLQELVDRLESRPKDRSMPGERGGPKAPPSRSGGSRLARTRSGDN